MAWYTVIITPAAKKSISLLPREYILRAKDTISALGEQPRPFGCLKLSGKIELYRIKVGSYRILYKIRDHDNTVVIAYVEPRDKAYKKLR